MRTTVTLDTDVERMLKQAMRRTHRSFKETLNRAVRAALGDVPIESDRQPFVLTARSLGLRARIDPTRFNGLADELDADAFRKRHARGCY